jgi:hypothetical protein
MLEWLILAAIVAAIASVLGYTVAASALLVLKIYLILAAVIALGVLCAALVDTARSRRRSERRV